jgi:murein L,D-transpeptidase YafK
MTPERMEQATENPDLPFWQNLKQGYDSFERTHIPPDVSVVDGSYVFENVK